MFQSGTPQIQLTFNDKFMREKNHELFLYVFKAFLLSMRQLDKLSDILPITMISSDLKKEFSYLFSYIIVVTST